MKTIRCYPAVGMLALALLIPSMVVAADPQSTFGERLDLVAVEVDLVVTDSKGRPVTDLDPADLELYHDGARQEILYLDQPASRWVPTPGHDGERGRQLVVYADNLRIWPKRRNAMLRRLDGFLEERIVRGDQVSIVAFDGSVELLTVDSRDVDRIRLALKALAVRPTAMAGVASEARQLRQTLDEGVDVSVLQPRIERYVERLRHDAARSVAGLAATIQAIAQPAHSVSILYLSDGIPAWPRDELSDLAFGSAPQVSISRGGDPSTQGVPTPRVQYLVTLPRSSPAPWRATEQPGTAGFLEPLIHIANAHGAAFYPVRPSAFSHPRVQASQSARGRADHIAPLRRLAHSTGGDFVPYSKFETALTKLSRRLDSAYALGFQVSAEEGRAPHTLEVQLARKGLKAHYRRAYTLDPGAGRPAGDQRAVASTPR